MLACGPELVLPGSDSQLMLSGPVSTKSRLWPRCRLFGIERKDSFARSRQTEKKLKRSGQATQKSKRKCSMLSAKKALLLLLSMKFRLVLIKRAGAACSRKERPICPGAERNTTCGRQWRITAWSRHGWNKNSKPQAIS